LWGILVSEGNVRRSDGIAVEPGRKKRHTSPFGLRWKVLSTCISQSPKTKKVWKAIKESLEESDVDYSMPSPKIFQINDASISRMLWRHIGVLSHRKVLPSSCFGKGKLWIEELFAGLIDGDGTINGSGDVAYDTTSWALASQVASLASRLGCYACIYDTPWRKHSKHQGYRVSIKLYSPLIGVKQGRVHKGAAPLPEYSKVVSVKEVRYGNEWTYDLSTESRAFSANGIRTHNSFHTGGVAGAKGSSAAGTFTRLDQLLQLPKTLPGAATLSTASGKVQRIEKDPAGGWSVFVEGQRHYAPATRELKVKRNQAVKKGDALTSGPKNPREMRELVGMNHVQSYLVNEIQNIYEKEAPIKRVNTETFVRAMTNLSEVKDPGSHDGFLPGDKVATSEIVAYNSKVSPDKQIKYDPLMQGVKHLPTEIQEDWIARLQSRDLKKTILDAAAEGWKSKIHSTHPIPGMAYGKDFGKGLEDQPWLY
jgi:hypothetical protein